MFGDGSDSFTLASTARASAVAAAGPRRLPKTRYFQLLHYLAAERLPLMPAPPNHSNDLPGQYAPKAAGTPAAVAPGTSLRPGRPSLTGAVASTATRLLPLVALFDAIQPSVSKESVFRIRRKKIKQHFNEIYAELHAARPRREALTHAFRALAELVQEETRDISKDELKQAAKEVVLATLQNAPALINIAHQARLLA